MLDVREVEERLDAVEPTLADIRKSLPLPSSSRELRPGLQKAQQPHPQAYSSAVFERLAL